MDVTPLVRAWIDGAVPNDGMVLAVPADRYYQGVSYYSSQATNPDLRPRLAVTLE